MKEKCFETETERFCWQQRNRVLDAIDRPANDTHTPGYVGQRKEASIVPFIGNNESAQQQQQKQLLHLVFFFSMLFLCLPQHNIHSTDRLGSLVSRMLRRAAVVSLTPRFRPDATRTATHSLALSCAVWSN